jgi:mannosyltransferase
VRAGSGGIFVPRTATSPRHSAPPPASEVAAQPQFSWLWLVLAAAIVVVAGILRFWALGRQSLWFDELFSANTALYGPRIAIKVTAQDTNPPLYYVLQSLIMPWLGRSEWAMRAMPAAFGVLTTGVMYLAGRKLFDRATGAWAAALFAVSAVALQYAQEARMYSLLMFFAALTLWLFALLAENPSPTRAAFLGVGIAGLAYTHVYGYLAAPILLLPVLLLPRLRHRVGRLMLVTYLVAGVLFLPWALMIPSQVALVRAQVAGGSWWMKPTVSVMRDVAANIEAFQPGGEGIPALIFVGLLVAAIAVPAKLAHTAEIPAGDGVHESDLLWVLLVFAFVPMTAGLLISKYITPIATVRNSLVCLPAAYLLVARGGVKLRWPGAIALAGLLLFAVLQLPRFYTRITKGGWHQATEIVLTEPKTGVLTQDWETDFNLESYSKLLKGEGWMQAMWVSAPDNKPSPRGRSIDGHYDESVPKFIWRWNRVYVVSMTEDSQVANYMNHVQGWKLAKIDDLGTPVVRLYERVDPAK